MNVSEKANKAWLIKQGDYILGPFSVDELLEKLRSEEIRISDEAVLPMKFWKPLHAWTELSDILKELNIRGMSTDSDFTKATQLKSGQYEDKTLNIYHESNPNHKSKDTLVESMSDSELLRQTEVRAPSEEDLKTHVSDKATQGASSSSYEQSTVEKNFDFEGSSESQAQVKKSLAWLASLTVVVVSVLAVFIFYYKGFEQPRQKKVAKRNYQSEALELWSRGDIGNALKRFSLAYKGPPRADKGALVYAGLLAYRGQTSRARSFFKKFHEPHLSQELQKKGFNGVGLTHFYDGQTGNAISFFKQAIEKDKNFPEARINLGIVFLQRADYEQAVEQFQMVDSLGFKSSLLDFVMGLSYYLWAKKNKDITFYNQSLSFFDKLTEQIGRYYQEALFYSALIFMETNQEFRLPDVALKILDVDPSLTENYRPNPAIFQWIYDWPKLLKSCKAVAKSLESIVYRDSLLALCQFKAGNNEAAKTAFETLEARHNSNPLVKALYAYVLEKQGLNLESSLVLGAAIEANVKFKNRLPYLLQARFCYKTEDYDCALGYFEKLYYGFSKDPSVFDGLVRTYWKKKNSIKANDILKKGLNFSESYTPLLELKGKV